MKVLYHHLLETTTVFGWLVSPLAPGMPGGPKSPFWPLRPASPLGPTCSTMPLSPFAPGMPAGPGFPFCPYWPTFSWWSYKASVSFLPFSSPVPFLPPRPWRTGRAWGTSQTLLTCWLARARSSLWRENLRISFITTVIGLSLQVFSGGSRRGACGVAPLIFRPNWGPKGRKKFFWRPISSPLIKGSGWPLPLILRSGSGTGIIS